MYFFEFIFWGRSFVILFKINLKIKKKIKKWKRKIYNKFGKKGKKSFLEK